METYFAVLLILFILSLFIFPGLGLVSSLMQKTWGKVLGSAGSWVMMIGFSACSVAALFIFVDNYPKIIFIMSLAAANGFLWPYALQKLACAKEKGRVYWFSLTLLPIVSGYLLFLIFRSPNFLGHPILQG